MKIDATMETATTTDEDMIFQVEKPFERLKNNGRVISARSTPRDEGEEVWIKSKTGEKEFEAVITNVEEIDWVDERNLVGHLYDHDIICGLASGLEWYQKLEDDHDEIPNPLYIHTVKRKTEVQTAE